MAEIWEQLPDESAVAYGAFLFFRESRPPRSVLKCYREWTKDPGKKKASGRWIAWSTQYQWRERAMAYDLHVDGIRRAAKEKAVAEIHEQRAREIELSAIGVLKETASLAHSNITNVIQWDAGEFDGVRITASKDLPSHVTGAIAKIKKSYDKAGRPQIEVEMHPKVRPIDLAGQHLSLWENAKDQAQKIQANAFLDFLNFLKSGGLKDMPREWDPPTLQNAPSWITITREGVPEDTKK